MLTVDEIIIAGGPSRTNVPGQWRVVLSPTPTAAWRDRLLVQAKAPATATLSIVLEGTMLFFVSGTTFHEFLTAMRALYRLLEEANEGFWVSMGRRGTAPDNAYVPFWRDWGERISPKRYEDSALQVSASS